MVLDTSAVIAILTRESEADRLLAELERDSVRYMSAASVVEAGAVVHARYGDHGDRELDLLLHRLGVEIVSVTAEQAELARAAYRRFGRGNHPARLNLGDVFSYALAVGLGEPLLFVGEDFSRTDVVVAGRSER